MTTVSEVWIFKNHFCWDKNIYFLFTGRRNQDLKEGYVQILIKMKMVFIQLPECTGYKVQWPKNLFWSSVTCTSVVLVFLRDIWQCRHCCDTKATLYVLLYLLLMHSILLVWGFTAFTFWFLWIFLVVYLIY
jgi:hypothetical protein